MITVVSHCPKLLLKSGYFLPVSLSFADHRWPLPFQRHLLKNKRGVPPQPTLHTILSISFLLLLSFSNEENAAPTHCFSQQLHFGYFFQFACCSGIFIKCIVWLELQNKLLSITCHFFCPQLTCLQRFHLHYETDSEWLQSLHCSLAVVTLSASVTAGCYSLQVPFFSSYLSLTERWVFSFVLLACIASTTGNCWGPVIPLALYTWEKKPLFCCWGWTTICCQGIHYLKMTL